MSEGKQENTVEPGQSWEIDLFRARDAQGIVQLFHTVYGSDYPVKTFMDADLLREENAAGKTISSVARTSKGDIVGHVALFRSAPFEHLFEVLAGLVLPAYRSGAIMSKLMTHSQDVAAEKFGVEVIFGEPVCNHVHLQKITLNQGWVTCALEVDLMPAAAYAEEKSASGRVSTLVGFKFRKPSHRKVYVPDAYREMLHFIYKDLGDEREFAPSVAELPSSPPTRIEAQIFDFAQVARLTLHEAGQDLDKALETSEKAALDKGVIVFQVWVKLSWPWIDQIVQRLRSRGYFAGGALPRWFDEDGFLMQKILARPNWEGIQIYSDRARKILEMIRADWERTQEA